METVGMETVGLLILMIIILGGGYLLTGSLDTLLDHLTIKDNHSNKPLSK